MSSPWADQKQAHAVERIAGALERIAEAVEQYAEADPLTVLNAALQGGDAVMAEKDARDEAAVRSFFAEKGIVDPADVVPPFANNGTMYVYRHPDPAYHVVLRPDPIEPGGFVASVEEAG